MSNKYEYNKKYYTINELVKIASDKYDNKLSYNLIRTRIMSNSYSSMDEILSLKKNKSRGKKNIYYKNKKVTINDLQKIAENNYNNKLSKQVIYKRLRKNNYKHISWILKEPNKKRKNYHKMFYNGKKVSYSDLQKIAKIKYNNELSIDKIYYRIHDKHLKIDKALSI